MVSKTPETRRVRRPRVSPAAPREKRAPDREDREIIWLPEILDSGAASALTQSLIAHRFAPTTVDAGRLRQIGAQCLQVLLSAAQTWRADKVSLAVVNLSAEIIAQMRAMGIDPALFIGGEERQ